MYQGIVNQGVFDVRDLKKMTDMQLMVLLNELGFEHNPKRVFVEKEWNKRKLGYKHLK
jgi:hypothetical protein